MLSGKAARLHVFMTSAETTVNLQPQQWQIAAGIIGLTCETSTVKQ